MHMCIHFLTVRPTFNGMENRTLFTLVREQKLEKYDIEKLNLLQYSKEWQVGSTTSYCTSLPGDWEGGGEKGVV